MTEPPAPTIGPAQVGQGYCDHCGSITIQVEGGKGVSSEDGKERACLQCIADGGGCCSLTPLNRWNNANV